MRNPRLHPLHINRLQRLIGLGTLEEHRIHPPPRTLGLRAGVPGYLPGGLVRAHHPISNLI